MISTKHDDVYYTTVKTTKADKVAQTADRKVTITAYITPKMPGVPVYFRVEDLDPDDPSDYEPDEDKGDNRDAVDPPEDKAGELSAPWAVTSWVMIDGVVQAAAEVELTITDKHSGDNYRVQASVHQDFSAYAETALLTGWKRIYVEKDKMFRRGEDLTEDAGVGTANTDRVTVANTAGFEIGDEVLIFDTDDQALPFGESPVIVNIAGNELIFGDNLTGTYEAGEWQQGGKMAYVGLKVDADGEEYPIEFYEADTSMVEQLFEQAFVEVKFPLLGAGPIPLTRWAQEPEDMELHALSERWWCPANRRKPNHIHLMGAEEYFEGSDKAGLTVSDNFDWTFIWVLPNETAHAKYNEDTTAHELVHHFSLIQGHCENLAFTIPEEEPPEKCIMYEEVRDVTNSIVRFCVPHISKFIEDDEDVDVGVRDAPDGL